MIDPQNRAKFQEWLSISRSGIALLSVLLLALMIASTAFGGAKSGLQEYDPDQDLVLRHTKTPTLEIVDLLPLQDTYITSNRPDQNYGQAADLWVGYDLDRTGGGAQRTYIEWAIDSVPDYVIINTAELWYYVFSVRPSGDPSMATNVRHLLDAWNADTLTWNNAVDIDWGGIAVEGQIPGAVGWRVVDVTDLVKDWASGGHVNNGLIVLGDESVQERERGFLSRNAAINLRPFLRINYTLTADTEPPTATMDPFVPDLIGYDTFNVSWSGQDNPGGTGIDYFDVQFDAADDGLGWINWLLHTTNSSAMFVGNSTTYQFRVRATDRAGNLSAWSSPESITVDTLAPVSIVLQFDPSIIHTNTFQVEWVGDDGATGSGIQYYDIYSRKGNEDWLHWYQAPYTITSKVFTATGDASYSFEATAVDILGNMEIRNFIPEAGIIVDIEPPFVVRRANLPLIFKDAQQTQ